MFKGILAYFAGLGLCTTKSYYDVKAVGMGDARVIVALLPDILLVISVLLSFKRSFHKFSLWLTVVTLIYFYVVLGFNGKGSSVMACNVSGLCNQSIDITCKDNDGSDYVGILYLLGSAIKIMAVTFIAKKISALHSNAIGPDLNITKFN